MSIRTSFNPMGTLGNVKLLESCLFERACVVTDVTSAVNERYDFDVSYLGGVTDVLEIFGATEVNKSRRLFRKAGNVLGLWRVFYGATQSSFLEFRTESNDAMGSLKYEDGLLTVDINGLTASHVSTQHVPMQIRIGLRPDPGRFRFRNLKVTQGGAMAGDFVPCLVGGEVCIKNLVTGAVLHASEGTLQL